MEADLEGASFKFTDWERAVLFGANLEKAKNISVRDLSKAYSLYQAKLDSTLLAEIKKSYPALLDKAPGFREP